MSLHTEAVVLGMLIGLGSGCTFVRSPSQPASASDRHAASAVTRRREHVWSSPLPDAALPSVHRSSPLPDAALPSVHNIDATCVEPGCVRSLQEAGSYAKSDLEQYLDEGVTIDNGYSVLVIEYVTDERTSLATLTIPYPVEPSPDGYAIVVNAHGTSGLDDPCQLSNTVYGTGLAGLFGARGAIGVAPDGPGLGTPGLAPYLVSEPAGRAVLDAMRAATQVAALLHVPISRRYAAVGLSEGGHSVLAAAAQHAQYAPELDVRAFAVAAPASVWFEKWQAGIAFDGSGVSSYAMLFYAWSDYYHYTGPSLWTEAMAARIDNVMATACAFDFGSTRTTYAQALGGQAAAVFAPDFLATFRAGELPPSAATLSQAFAENRIGPYQQTAPLAVFQGDSDTVVLLDDTTELVRELQQAGLTVDYHIVLGAEHNTTAYGFVNQHQVATDESIRWVLDHL